MKTQEMNVGDELKERPTKALGKTYDYISNVIVKQNRFLEAQELYEAYKSMHFKDELAEEIFIDFYGIIVDELEKRWSMKPNTLIKAERKSK